MILNLSINCNVVLSVSESFETSNKLELWQLSLYFVLLLCLAVFMACFHIENTSSQTFGKLYAVL